MIEFLTKTALFKGVDSREINNLMKDVDYRIKKYSKGEFIAFRGDPVEAYMLVKKGTIIAEMQKVNGKVMQIETLIPYKEVAPSFVFGKNNVFPVDIHAKEETEIFCLSTSELLLLLQKNQIILRNLLNSFSNKTQFLSKKLSFANKTIEEKLATYILENCVDEVFLLKKSMKDLAELFGVSRPSLSRVIISWVDEGTLERTDSKSFKILNKDALLDKF